MYGVCYVSNYIDLWITFVLLIFYNFVSFFLVMIICAEINIFYRNSINKCDVLA